MNQIYTILISHFTEAIAYNLALGAIFWALLLFTRKYAAINTKSNYTIGLFMQSILFINFLYFLLTNPSSKLNETNSFNLNNNFNINNYISIIYVSLLLFKIVKLSIQNNRQISYSQIENDKFSQLQNWVKRKKEQFGITRNIQIQISDKLKSPFTKGVFLPIIVLPLAAINQMSTYQMEAILMHELTHIKRMDYLWNALQLIMETILYFNPFMYWIGKMVREDRELICDKNVILNGYNSVEYIKSLLFFTKDQDLKKSDLVALNITGNQPSEFYNRVITLLGKENKRSNNIWSFPALILGFVSIFALAKSNIQFGSNNAKVISATSSLVTLTDGNNNFQKFYADKINNSSENIDNQIINSNKIIRNKSVTITKHINIPKKRVFVSTPKIASKEIEPAPIVANSNFSLARYLPIDNSNIKIFKKVVSKDKIVYQIDYQNNTNKNALFNKLIQAFAQQNTIMASSVSNIYYARNNVVEEQKIIQLNTAENNYVFISTGSALQIVVSKNPLNNIN
ncbi:M56 family metallopeptidase [Rhizosphaericola mali]|uniref:M56 family metallopeptidase n=1 Tax=Rhizosphaericola mali TaxID=2545455 RepID=A0A5P2FV95_9BACT|nr:M56 family metallopeptidase [Rhizosphaericola mali]QES87404.1 M56 family metallopeptidase [Rhizosphaericola mali]